jgi:phosphoribosyl-ATP pyrophosphohydrolase/phosphoribosyl-AMP cyclohydrolase
MSTAFLQELQEIIDARLASGDAASSYTQRLATKGIMKVAQKVGEEGVETALAAVAGDDSDLLEESADLIFHLLVLLRVKQLSLTQVCEVLAERHQQKAASTT